MKLPKKVNIIEVGPRDGFQNVKEFIDTDVKIKIINQLIDTGIKRMEVTSFVNPKAIPQMKDAKDVIKAIKESEIEQIALIPNLKGAELAIQSGIKQITFVLSASESHNMANTRRTVAESLQELAQIKTMCDKNNVHLRVDIATSFGCHFEGKIKKSVIIEMVKKINAMGVNEIILCDTTGMANPLLVEQILTEVKKQFESLILGVHFHNTRGVGMANIITAIMNGVYNIETSIGGLGGCPFSPGASGNVATEDVVNILNDMGVKTEIDLQKLLECSAVVKEVTGQQMSSHVLIAGPTFSGSACRKDGIQGNGI